VNQCPDVTAALIRRGVQHVRVCGINYDIGHAGVFADGQGGLPGFAAVSRLVQTAVTARPPQWPLRRDVNDIAVRGSRTMRAMCSDFFSPMFFQLLPPSSER